jgi:hypothetical protein
MRIPQNTFTMVTVPFLVQLLGIYLTLWLSGFRDTQRRWVLLVCLFGLVVAQQLAIELTVRLSGALGEAGRPPGRIPPRARLAQVACSLGLMLALGIVLKLTA